MSAGASLAAALSLALLTGCAERVAAERVSVVHLAWPGRPASDAMDRDTFLEAEAAALAEAARRAREDAIAEEGYALSIIAARREIDDRAVAFFSRTYGVTRDALVAAIR